MTLQSPNKVIFLVGQDEQTILPSPQITLKIPPFPLYLKFPSLSPLFKIPLSPLFKIPPISSLFKASLFLLPLLLPSYNPSPVSIFHCCLQRKCKWHLGKVINCRHYPSQVLQIIPHSTN